jgi:hypothetical protein
MITWISWENHRRTKELCAYLGIENKVFSSKRSRWLRHPAAIKNTIQYLLQKKPQTVILQCPSVFLGLLGCLLKPLLGYTLIIDAHNAALYPDTPTLRRFYFLYKTVHRFADVVVVTNEHLTNIVTRNGGRAFVLPDKLFEPPDLEPIPLRSKHNIAYVCSFYLDEPYLEVFEAFRDAKDTTLYVTGHAPQDVLEHYSSYQNIVFTGFTPLKDYLTLLRSVDGVIALTTRENSMLCAANEAVSFSKPMMISDGRFLRSYFTQGTLYTKNTATAIRETYQVFLQEQEKLAADMSAFKPQLSQRWEVQGEKFKRLVYASKDTFKRIVHEQHEA